MGAPKNWCFEIVLEKTLHNPLDCKEIQPVHPKEDQSWVFIGRTGAEAETLVLWPPHGKSWLIGKDPDAGRDWGQEEKGTTEDEMTGWHHWLNGHGFDYNLGVGDGQGGLASCDFMGSQRVGHSWATELNWTELMMKLKLQYFGLLMWRTQLTGKDWCWERLRAREGSNRAWDGWMASLTQWTWVWGNSRR